MKIIISRFPQVWTAKEPEMTATLRKFLADLYRTAVAAAHPANCLPPLLPEPPIGRVILLAAGKAAGSMAETAEETYFERFKLARERLMIPLCIP